MGAGWFDETDKAQRNGRYDPAPTEDGMEWIH
jgi:hypothetical protein